MFFEEDLFNSNHNLLNLASDDIDEFINCELAASRRCEMNYFPTHTEDGIAIRKLYIANLPPKTTRGNLFNVFAQYGFIKSCWIRQNEPRRSNRIAGPTYAFVTYSYPKDAFKALTAPQYEKCINGRRLHVSPADSWHQPIDDSDDRSMRIKKYTKCNGGQRELHYCTFPPSANTTEDGQMATSQLVESSSSTDTDGVSSNSSGTTQTEQTADSVPVYTILDILNRDCLYNILSFIPIHELIKSERVSKEWQILIQEYLDSMRIFKTSWWQHPSVTLTTAVLRRVLGRVGGSLTRLHIDNPMSALNDRTAHSVGKYCPNLEELKVVNMNTKNWNPLMYGCKKLKYLSFYSCRLLADTSLVYIVNNDSNLQSLTVVNNARITGVFLTDVQHSKLNSLSFFNCYNLQPTFLYAAIDKLVNLTTLRLDVCQMPIWTMVPSILNKLPNLEVLSLSEYTSSQIRIDPSLREQICASFTNLTKLKVLNLSQNVFIDNKVLKNIGQYCTELRSLDVSSCNGIKHIPQFGVGDEGIRAVCRGCPQLTYLDISYLVNLTDAGVKAVTASQQLATLIAKGQHNLTTEGFAQCLASCHYLQVVDLCGCDLAGEEVLRAAEEAVERRPRPLLLRLAGTCAHATYNEEYSQWNKLVTLDFADDRCDIRLRQDYDDYVSDDGSDQYISLDEIDDDFFGSDDNLFVEDFLYDEDMDGPMFAYELHAPNILLL